MSDEVHGALTAIGEAVGDLLKAPGSSRTPPAPRRTDPLLRPAFVALVFAGGAICGAAAVVAAFFIGLLQGGI